MNNSNYNQQYYQKHRKYLLKQSKIYANKHKKETKQWQKIWRKKNKSKIAIIAEHNKIRNLKITPRKLRIAIRTLKIILYKLTKQYE